MKGGQKYYFLQISRDDSVFFLQVLDRVLFSQISREKSVIAPSKFNGVKVDHITIMIGET